MKLILLFLFTLLNFSSCKDDPVRAENQKPIILSLTVFPNVIGSTDSVIVICNAMDPDGDTLVYDWVTDGKSKIKGVNTDEHWLYHTYDNSRVFYPKNLNSISVDTLWIQCFARDGKGKSDNGLISYILKK